MHQTLLYIPHWVFQGPLLVAWLIVGLLILGWLYRQHGNSSDTWSFLPVMVVVAIVIHFVLPGLEVNGINPDDPSGAMIPQGLAIRGYGAFLVLAIAAGVGIVSMRAPMVGITTDQIIGLGFWMMVAGIAGARIFYVIQKSDEFFTDGVTLSQIVLAVVDMTKGGLVVYGSLIGGMIAGVAYLKINRLPMARVADLIAPGMVLGLAIGRIGCLMNGCCYGGVCSPPLPSVTFPAGSPPYMKQLADGDLIGLSAQKNTDLESQFVWVVDSVEPNSIGAKLGLQAGDQFTIQAPNDRYIRFQKENPGKTLDGKDLVGIVYTQRLGELLLPVSELPTRSLETHPTQVYSAINAGLLCLVLWFYWTIRKSDGEVFALMLILYSIGRFLMELIRQDELGQFGTQLTISQWVSLAMMILGLMVLSYARFSKPSPLPQPISPV